MTQTNAAKYEDVDHVSGTQTLKSSDWDDDRRTVLSHNGHIIRHRIDEEMMTIRMLPVVEAIRWQISMRGDVEWRRKS